MTEIAKKMYEYTLEREAGGYENYFDRDKLKIINLPTEHLKLFNTETLRIIVPEIKKFLGK